MTPPISRKPFHPPGRLPGCRTAPNQYLCALPSKRFHDGHKRNVSSRVCLFHNVGPNSHLGKDLSTAEGQEWKTRREVIASCFNEPNNEVFEGHTERSDTSTSANYKSSVQMILENCVLIMALGRGQLPRLKCCLAIMLEMIRLYTAVPVSKWVGGDQTVTLRVGCGKTTIVLPPKTMFITSYAALQTDPKYWGPDALVWRPSRWIQERRPGQAKPGDETLITIKKSAFLGWKFSQVEFVATLAALFRDWRVDPAPLHDGESRKAARKRVLDLIEHDWLRCSCCRFCIPKGRLWFGGREIDHVWNWTFE
ncbi:hypothetical protein B0H63DRAFT_449950 [Podospora didyma]|uniref:Cytochrome P450 n=1 Tax=Podospora didyma TaxID=330526 RepID=A0AAE0NQP1_9PEZI|nr:hypothetical protein B0H63DRAFT_449950 [Podospora didyma]